MSFLINKGWKKTALVCNERKRKGKKGSLPFSREGLILLNTPILLVSYTSAPPIAFFSSKIFLGYIQPLPTTILSLSTILAKKSFWVTYNHSIPQDVLSLLVIPSPQAYLVTNNNSQPQP